MLNTAKARRGPGWKPWKSSDEEEAWHYGRAGQHFQEGHLQFLSILCSAAKDRFGTAWPVCMEDVGAVETRRVLGGRSAPQNIATSYGVLLKSKVTNCFWDLWGALSYCRSSALLREPSSSSQSPESQCGWTKHHKHTLSFLSTGWEILPVGLE